MSKTDANKTAYSYGKDYLRYVITDLSFDGSEYKNVLDHIIPKWVKKEMRSNGVRADTKLFFRGFYDALKNM